MSNFVTKYTRQENELYTYFKRVTEKGVSNDEKIIMVMELLYNNLLEIKGASEILYEQGILLSPPDDVMAMIIACKPETWDDMVEPPLGKSITN